MIVGDPLFFAFLSFTLIFVATPGSTTAVVVRNTLDGGRRAGVFAALGAACANVTHATVAGLGGAALLRAWPGALDAIKLAGGAYLAYLGLRSAWMAIRGATPLLAALDQPSGLHHRSFREGLTVNLLGPAVMTYYLAGVPTFMRPTWPRWTYVFLATVHVASAFACHAAWALALHRLRVVFREPGPRRVLGLATAAALVALGVRIALRS
jgi:threonine/homoserine/homoserine lactone efflux protein